MTNKLKVDKADLLSISPITSNQSLLFHHWGKHQIFVLHGFAGTGKTFISLYKAIEEVLHSRNKKLIIVRSAVSTRDIGHLPGDITEKTEIYELPYNHLVSSLFPQKDVYTRLKEQGKLEFLVTSFIRGLTFDNSIIIVDEVQNLTYHELYSVITRVGDKTKIVFCGDFKQADEKNSGLHRFLNVLRCMNSVCFIEFTSDDIVRSKLVKEFIIAESNVNL